MWSTLGVHPSKSYVNVTYIQRSWSAGLLDYWSFILKWLWVIIMVIKIKSLWLVSSHELEKTCGMTLLAWYRLARIRWAWIWTILVSDGFKFLWLNCVTSSEFIDFSWYLIFTFYYYSTVFHYVSLQFKPNDYYTLLLFVSSITHCGRFAMMHRHRFNLAYNMEKEVGISV